MTPRPLCRWGTRADMGASGVHFFSRSPTGSWHSLCGLVSTMALTRKAALHAGMAARGLCCGLCRRKRKKGGGR